MKLLVNSTLDILTTVQQPQLSPRMCPECGGTTLTTDGIAAEIICRECGLVVTTQVLNREPEWRAFTIEERAVKSRVGPPASLRRFDKGLTTTFQPSKDRFGRTLSLQQRLKMSRLLKWHIRANKHSSTSRNLLQAMNVLTRLADTLRIPNNVQETAAQIYRKALAHDLVKGRSIKAIAAASLYVACRLTYIPRSLKTIVDASTRDRKEITRCYRLLLRELKIQTPIDDPVKYIPQIASHTGLSQHTQNIATRLLQQAKDIKGVTGKGPVGVAAAVLYIASMLNGERTTQRDVADAADVTEVTVRNRFKHLEKLLGLQISKHRRRYT